MAGESTRVIDEDARSPKLESRPKVLVVDDVRANLRVMGAVLEPLDCEVIFASSGSEALALLPHHDFAVFLLDVQMPVMDGYALAQALRQDPKTQDVPIIFLTAASLTDENVLRGYGSGAVDFLFKPLNQTILCSKVRVFLDLFVSQQHALQAKKDLERAYEELKTTQSQLVQSAKVASLGELVAGIAHEINNPLAFSLSHLGTARRSLAKAEELIGLALPPAARNELDRAATRLREMDVGLERIQGLVTKLRVFSRLDEGEWKAIGMRESVESVLMILAHRTKGRIVVETKFGDPDVVECYPTLLNQAILNLVANAVDAMPESGNLTIRTGELAGSYEISVEDSGPGIPAALRERVLEPFFTTKPVGQGTGLGLSISSSIARKHGGTLLIDCPERGGTRATIRFPLALR
jgi:two-component system, NtrC family, sensor kinase